MNAVVFAVAALVFASCQPRVAPQPPADPYGEAQTHGPAFGPLPATGHALQQHLVAVEVALEQGVPVDHSGLAALRMTRSAVELIDENATERALDQLERAIAIDGRSGFPYIYIGYLHLQQGRPDQASAFIERAAVLLPSSPALDAEVQSLRLAAVPGGQGRGQVEEAREAQTFEDETTPDEAWALPAARPGS